MGLNADIVDKDIKRIGDQWIKLVPMSTILKWADKDVKKNWRVTSAARLIHICRTGYDCKIDIPKGERYPSVPVGKIPIRMTTKVPGQPNKSENLYHVGQVVSRLAQASSLIKGQQERLREAFDLVDKLKVELDR